MLIDCIELCKERRIPIKTYVFLSFITVTTMGCANKSLGLAQQSYPHESFQNDLSRRIPSNIREFQANESLYELSDSSYFQML